MLNVLITSYNLINSDQKNLKSYNFVCTLRKKLTLMHVLKMTFVVVAH